MSIIESIFSIELREAVLIGIDKESYESEKYYATSYGLSLLCLKFKLTLIYGNESLEE